MMHKDKGGPDRRPHSLARYTRDCFFSLAVNSHENGERERRGEGGE